MMKHAYSIKKKLIVIKLAKDIGVRLTHLRTGIPLSNIYRWMSRMDDYSTVKNTAKVRRIGYKGTTMLSTSQELDLLKWIHDRNSNDLSVCHAIVSHYCRITINTTNCTFTTGWFARFMKERLFV